MTKISENISSYSKHYSDSSLLEKIANVANKAGKKVIKLALTLYYVLKLESVSFENKVQIIVL